MRDKGKKDCATTILRPPQAAALHHCPHPRTCPTARFPRTTCRTPPQPPHFSLVTTLCHQVPPPHFAPPTQPLIYPQRNNDPRAPTPSPSPNFPPGQQPAHLLAKPSVALPPRPISARPASAPYHLVRPRSPPRNRKKNRYAIGHLDIYAAHRPQKGYRPLFSSVFRPAKEPEVLFFADYCYICQFQNWDVP